MLKVINPATDEVIAHLKEDNENDVHEAYYLSKTKQIIWAETPYFERKEIIRKFRNLLYNDKLSAATELSLQMGKPLKASLYEIETSCERIDWFINETEKYLKPETVHEEKNLTEKMTYNPLGVIGNISAWNYPTLLELMFLSQRFFVVLFFINHLKYVHLVEFV